MKTLKDVYRLALYTPVGPFKFPDLTVPKKWDESTSSAVVDWEEGSYSCKVVLPEDAVADMQRKVEEAFQVFIEAKKEEKPKTKNFDVCPVFGAELDDEGEETGNVIISARMKAQFENKRTGEIVKQRPILVDSTGAVLKGDARPNAIWGGTTGALKVTLNPYINNDAKQFRMSYRLKAVQIVQLVGPGDEDTSGFGAVDGGFTARADSWDDEGVAERGESEDTPAPNTGGDNSVDF